MSSPKTLAERLDWMAKHIPGFREEREAVYFAQREAMAGCLAGYSAITRLPVASELVIPRAARASDALVVGQIVSQVTSINCAI